MVMNMYIIEDSTCNNLKNLSEIVRKLIDKLSIFLKNEDILYDIKLIISELAVNGLEHGNSLDLSKKLYLSIYFDDKKIIIKVKDQGEGFDYRVKDSLVSNCESSGRGFFIVERLVDSLKVNNNEIVAELYL